MHIAATVICSVDLPVARHVEDPQRCNINAHGVESFEFFSATSMFACACISALVRSVFRQL